MNGGRILVYGVVESNDILIRYKSSAKIVGYVFLTVLEVNNLPKLVRLILRFKEYFSYRVNPTFHRT